MQEELASEDLLRLQVLLTQELRAVRLDEAGMTLTALTDRGEITLPLHPAGRPERYLRLVQELLAGHALGSPGGYPVYLSRWTRHGQLETEDLGKLLRIGEPEAVVAVMHAPALTDELAEYAWWAMPTIDNARLMLRREAVARGHMGRILADFLVEHLPFLQDDHLAIMDSTAVLLASGALDEAQRLSIWRRGRNSNNHYVAFLEAPADGLPTEEVQARDWLAPADLQGLIDAGNAAARLLQWACGTQGQAFLAAAEAVLARPETQEVATRLFDAVGSKFNLPDETGLAAARLACPGLDREWLAVAAMSRTSAAQLAPIFARSTAIGSLMRRKIEPLVSPLRRHIRVLRGEAE